MGIIRFSTVEQGGLVMLDGQRFTGAGIATLGRLMLHAGGSATVLGPNMLEDITPLYFTEHASNYWLTTGPEEPTVEATIHVLPHDPKRVSTLLNARTGVFEDVHDATHLRVPTDTVAFPLLSLRDASGEPTATLRAHELIVTTQDLDPHQVIESLRA